MPYQVDFYRTLVNDYGKPFKVSVYKVEMAGRRPKGRAVAAAVRAFERSRNLPYCCWQAFAHGYEVTRVPTMTDWNVLVTTHGDGFRDARKILERFGEVHPTDFLNVIVLKVDDPAAFIERLSRLAADQPGILNFISHILPAQNVFSFQTPEEFERKAGEAVLLWAPALTGKSFHVRMHRRGFKGKPQSPVEERFLDKALFEATQRLGEPARVSFDDPDAILSVETVGPRAGLSLWTREDLRRYPFLALD